MMIASVRGLIQLIAHDHLVIETAGVGLQIFAPRPTLGALGPIGSEVFLYTQLIVREDALTLYGFSEPAQRAVFDVLLGISGVGPRVALSMLSAYSPDEIRATVARNDAAALARVPGIGKKTAERLLLELKGRLDLKGLPVADPANPAAAPVDDELATLLMGLGYSNSEASAAIAALPADAPADLEQRLRLALRYFGSV
jgi:Holliday junction DNA helicase RuvA